VGAVGAPTLSAFLDPVLAQMLVLAEVSAFLLIVFSALFASQHVSERAFRFLRWCGDRPEPSSPPPEQGQCHQGTCVLGCGLGRSSGRGGEEGGGRVFQAGVEQHRGVSSAGEREQLRVRDCRGGGSDQVGWDEPGQAERGQRRQT
jgi:hypothetical protein